MIDDRRARLLALRREALALQAGQQRHRLAAQVQTLLEPLSAWDAAISLWRGVRSRPWLLALPLAGALVLRRVGWLKHSSQLVTLWRLGRRIHKWWSRTRGS